MTAYVTTRQAHLKGEDSFVNAKGLATLAARWGGTRLVEIWNKLPNVKKVRKFTDRRTAIARIWNAVQDLKPLRATPYAERVPAPPHLRNTTDSAGVRGETKTERIIALLNRTSGATLAEIMEETNWQRHSVRGFISQLPRRLGFRIKSYKRDGERVYRIR